MQFRTGSLGIEARVLLLCIWPPLSALTFSRNQCIMTQ